MSQREQTSRSSLKMMAELIMNAGRARRAHRSELRGAESGGASAGGGTRRSSRAFTGGAYMGGVDRLDQLEPRVLMAGDHPSFDAGAFPNPPATLITLTAGQGSQSGNIGTAGDDDLFRFVATQDNFVSVLADTVNESPTSALDSRIEIYSAAGQQLRDGNDNGNLTTGLARDGWAGFIAQNGQTYFLRVLSNNASGAGSIGRYTVRVNAAVTELTSLPPPPPPPAPALPPFFDATTGDARINGTIVRAQEDVLFRFDTRTQTNAIFDSLMTIGAQTNQTTSRLNSRLDVYNSSGQLIAFDSETGRLSNAFTIAPNARGNVLYIRVRSDDLSTDPAPTARSRGTFTLAVDAAATDLAVDPVSRKVSTVGSIASGVETSLFSFTSKGTGLTFVTAVPQPIPPLQDPALRLYSTGASLLAFNDDYSGQSSQIEASLIGDTKYYVVVESFDNANGGVFFMFVESNYTFDPRTNSRNDEAPQLGLEPRAAQSAIPLYWSAPFLQQDPDANPVLDRGWLQSASTTGRIFNVGDRDLYSFVPPVDMLGEFGGNDDDAGTSLFLGGRFNVADPLRVPQVASRNVTTWDGGDFWYVGRQNVVNNVQFGFVDNPTTPGTAGPEIFAFYDWQTSTRENNNRSLVVGGDFDLVVPGPLGPVTFRNLAVWTFNPLQGRYVWASIGDVNGPVRAITGFDPTEFDPDGDGPADPLPDPNDFGGATQFEWLAIGGNFTSVRGTAATSIAFYDLVQDRWSGVTGVTGTVNALQTWQPPDPGAGREPNVGPPALDRVLDPPAPPNTLFIGGDITLTGTMVRGIVRFDGHDLTAQSLDINSPSRPDYFPRLGGAGIVHALEVYQPPAANGITPPERLVIAGDFSFQREDGLLDLEVRNMIDYGFPTDPETPFGDPADPDYDPRLEFFTPGVIATEDWGTNGPIFALAVWDPPDVTGNELVDAPRLVIGGQFTAMGTFTGAGQPNDPSNNITTFNGYFKVNLAPPPLAPDGVAGGVVRTIAILTDQQEPGVPVLSIGDQQVIYAGGTFTSAGGNNAIQFVAQFSFREPQVGNFVPQWTGLNSGVQQTAAPATTAVFALSSFDDHIAGQWDRNDRPSGRIAITVSPTSDAFINMFIRVYDSSLNLIYSNDTIAPPFPDPAGAIDRASGGSGQVEQTLVIPAEVWGGETMYVEVGGLNDGGSGRYTISIQTDGSPPDLNADGFRDPTDGVLYSRPPGEGQWSRAARMFIDPDALGVPRGDSRNSLLSPIAAYTTRQYRFHPSGTTHIDLSELGVIETIDDVNLYFFRAEFTGTAEVRVATTNIQDEFVERLISADGSENRITKNNTYSSNLDSALRVFSNDLENVEQFIQIGYNDDPGAVLGETQVTNVGAFQGRGFTRRDARVVFPIEAGRVYFVQVESAQHYKFGEPQNAAQRVFNVSEEIDQRYVTGAYELLLHTMPNAGEGTNNGQRVADDYVNVPALGQGVYAFSPQRLVSTVIPVKTIPGSPGTGEGTISGAIRATVEVPFDNDTFNFIVAENGNVQISVRRTSGSLIPDVRIYNEAWNNIAGGVAVTDGTITLDVEAIRGEKLFVVIAGSGTSEGEYRIDITGRPNVDDHADAHKWSLATDLRLLNFLGRAQATGSIESQGDTDVFRFSVDDFLTMNIIVATPSVTFVPLVEVYEVTEDLRANPVFTRIAWNQEARTDGTRRVSSVTFPVSPNRTSGTAPNRTYPFYYIAVRASDPQTQSGTYDLTLEFPPTDDHANQGDFNFATRIVVDPSTGLGGQGGRIELLGDTDLFFFEAPASGAANVTITRPTTSLIRPRLTLIAEDRTTVLGTATGADDGTLSVASFNFNVIRTRVYYVLAEGFGPPNVNTQLTGTYTVNVTAPAVDDYPNVGEFDIAFPIALSRTNGNGVIGGPTVGDPLNARLSPSNDTDLFRFTTIATGDVVVRVDSYAGPFGNFAPRVTVFDSNFTQVLTAAASTPAGNVSVTITGAANNAVYYVLVDAVAGVPGAAATGEFRLLLDGPTPTTDPDGQDPGFIDFNNPSQIVLSPRTGDGDAQDIIERAGDRDLFVFTAPNRSGRAFVKVITPNGSLLDASVKVLAQPNESVTLVFDSDGLPGSTAQTSFQANAGQVYYIVVAGIGATTGSYTLLVNTVPVTNFLVFPEGFASEQIRQFVSIVNPNSFAVNYSVVLYYEGIDAFTVAYTGTVEANRRDASGVTIIDGPGFQAPGLRLNTPYALVVESDGPLGATFAHYDFGTSIGDALTERTSKTWAFPRVERSAGQILDFIVYYNPNPFPVVVELKGIQDGREVTITSPQIGANRRGGWAINDQAALPFGVFGAVLTARAANPADESSNIGVVASISHYDTVRGGGWGTIGDPDGGSTNGAMPSVTFAPGVESDVTFLNPTNAPVTVTITGKYIGVTLPDLRQTYLIQPRSSLFLKATDLGIAEGVAPVGLSYSTENVKISAITTHFRFGDADATGAGLAAGTRFWYGDAFMDGGTAGTRYFEFLNLHNPTDRDTTVSVRLIFLDGTSNVTPVLLRAGAFSIVNIHDLPIFSTERTGLNWFGLELTANVPFVSTFTHYDLSLGGGWSANGVPLGIVDSLALIARR
jgi:hypothetical protein